MLYNIARPTMKTSAKSHALAGECSYKNSEKPGRKINMTKDELLDIIKLLSALEGWSFAEKHRLPDYLLEDLDKTVELLSAEVLK